MSSIKSVTQIREQEDAEGNITRSVTETTTKVERSEEPEYIKLYTRVWCEFNRIPLVWRELFLQLALRMSFASTLSDHGGQIVATGGTFGREIRDALNWKEAQWYKGLAALCDCHAIRKIGRGEYQINPSYAGRGQWKYNPRLEQGGIEDIVASFDFKEGKVDTNIIWADDGSPGAKELRDNVGKGAVIKEQRFSPTPNTQKRPELAPLAPADLDTQLPGQMTLPGLEEHDHEQG